MVSKMELHVCFFFFALLLNDDVPSIQSQVGRV